LDKMKSFDLYLGSRSLSEVNDKAACFFRHAKVNKIFASFAPFAVRQSELFKVQASEEKT